MVPAKTVGPSKISGYTKKNEATKAHAQTHTAVRGVGNTTVTSDVTAEDLEFH